MAAARQLRDAGRSVIVLEARERIGGRLHTRASGLTRPGPGRHRIHGDNPSHPAGQLVPAEGARLARPSSGRDQVYDSDGRPASATVLGQLDQLAKPCGKPSGKGRTPAATPLCCR